MLGTIKYEEIEYFFTLIKKINPSLIFKMLLISENDKYNEIKYDLLYHRIYNISKYKEYINECFPIDASNSNNLKYLNDISDDEK